MNLKFYSFNNYYNRIVKKHENVLDYGTPVETIDDVVNWNPNDGIYAQQLLPANSFNTDIMPDYMLAVDGGMINSRWFVIEAKRERSRQFTVTLYRDVIADWYDQVVNAPCFIEKATLDIKDPAIFNNEEMTFNQIKSGEYKIDDHSGMPWVAIYMAKKATGEQSIPSSFSIETVNVTPDYEITNWNEYTYATYRGGFYGDFSKFEMYIKLKSQYTNASIEFNWDGTGNILESTYLMDGQGIKWNKANYEEIISTLSEEVSGTNWKSKAYDYAIPSSGLQIVKDTSPIYAENGKIVKIGSSYYELEVVQITEKSFQNYISITSDLGKELSEIARTLPEVDMSNIVGTPYGIKYTVPWLVLEANPISPMSSTLNVSENRTKTLDAAYDVIMIPAGDYELLKGGSIIECNRDIGLRFAAEIGLQPETIIYDVQLLPYGPLNDEYISQSPSSNKRKLISLPSNRENVDYSYIMQGDTVVGFAMYLSSKDFSKRLYHDFTDLRQATNAIDKKVNSECDMLRLVSPNYDGAFEYNIEKIGDPRYYNVYCSLKPYQPYIYVSPDFNGSLYGSNFADNRGLVCNGDFSLPRSIDQWITYQLNNKNYQNVFNRQIQNMEVTNKANRLNDIVGAISGTASATVYGSRMGVAGAVASGVASAGAGAADVIINEALRSEAMDYTKDLFGYNLGNIKALPNVLAKIGAFDITNKIYPFVERYTATDMEKQALRDKIKYNGMTVMRIGNIMQFLKTERTYIKCKLIRAEDVMDDYHVVNTIATELNKGVFI